MKILSALAMMLAMVTASGCAARNVYDSLRFRQDMECQKLQGNDRDECSRRSGMNYDEYRRQLKEQDRQK